MPKEEIKPKTLNEVSEALQFAILKGNGDLPFKVSIPYRNGLGLHYEDVVNITTHEGIVDLHTTMPDSDDIKENNDYRR